MTFVGHCIYAFYFLMVEFLIRLVFLDRFQSLIGLAVISGEWFVGIVLSFVVIHRYTIRHDRLTEAQHGSYVILSVLSVGFGLATHLSLFIVLCFAGNTHIRNITGIDWTDHTTEIVAFPSLFCVCLLTAALHLLYTAPTDTNDCLTEISVHKFDKDL